MHLYIFLGILMFKNGILGESLKKCCDADSYLVNSKCETDVVKRIQILTDEVDLLSKLKPKQNHTNVDYCVDVTDEKIIKYRIEATSIIEESNIDINYYPKCCPLNHYYNSEIHSCIRNSEQFDYSFISQKFIRVGLPHCRIINDYRLNSGNQTNYRIELGNLHLDKPSFQQLIFPDGSFCIDRDEHGDLVARGCQHNLGICNNTRCIHKCCPDGQSFVNGNHCVDTYEHGLNLSFSDRIKSTKGSFAVVHNFYCKLYILKDRIMYTLDENGAFWPFYNTTNSFRRFDVADKSYCIEHLQKNEVGAFKFFMCFLQDPVPTKFLVTRWAKIVSCIFLVLTIVIYLMLPEMMNLIGKTLISFCTDMLFLFILLTYGQFQSDREHLSCLITSFLTLYTSISSFTWLNVMCFDIWQTCGSKKSLFGATVNRNELKRFLLYSLYGWGLPLIPVLIVLSIHRMDAIPYAIRPYLATYKCFWDNRTGNYAMLLYYSIPLMIIEIVNVVLFIKTILYCLKVKNEIKRMDDNRKSIKERKKSYHANKDQLILIFKLGVIMGISFIFEVLSSQLNMQGNSVLKYVEVIWDTINCLQGLFIFVIFVCKLKVLRLLRTRLCGANIRNVSMRSSTTRQTSVLLHNIKETGSN